MDDVGRWTLLIIFFILSFLFCAAECALLSTSEAKLQKAADQRKDNPPQAWKLLSKNPMPKQILRMNLCYMICSIAATYFGVSLLFPFVLSFCRDQLDVISPEWVRISLQYVILILSFLIFISILLTLNNVLPKKLFLMDTESFLFKTYRGISILSLVFRPFIFIMVHLSNVIAKILGHDTQTYPERITEEQIRNLVDAGGEKGIIEEEEREMINNIFDFDDKDVADLMTHRTDIVGLEIHSKISDVVYHAINDGFSRIPVYENDLDNIKGIIYVKDLLCLVGCKSSEDFKLEDFIREAIYVPEAKKCSDLFRIFKAKKAHMAVVVDDYGGTAGIVSMEDLLESIVGNIQDEYDDEQEQIVQLEDHSYILDGATDLEDIEKLFHVTFDVDEDIDTLGGLITNTLGRIPKEEETPSITIEQIQFTVMVVKDQRIARVKAVALSTAPAEK
jgi:putative hemolysin